MDVKDIKDLILTIDKTSIESVEIEQSGFVIRVNKRSKIENNVIEKVSNTVVEMKNDTQETNAIEDNENTYLVKSPMVGTFYGSPSPDSASFVKVGDKIEKGQTLCIVEAMKMMNEVKSDSEGIVVEVLVNSEDIVEYGQPLMRIRG